MKQNYKLKYEIIERMLVNQMKWNFSANCLKEGEKFARQLIKRQINIDLKQIKNEPKPRAGRI